MKKIYLFAILLLGLASCSSEDSLQPSNADTDPFTVSDDATDAESVLRRNFFNTNGSYLLFNDTLKTGELLDLGYVMTASTYTTVYTYDYLTTIEEKQQAVDFVDTYIVPHLGTKLQPFSYLLVNNIHCWEKSGATYSEPWSSDPNPTSVVGKRGTAIAMSALEGADEETITSYAENVMQSILINNISNQTSDTYTQFLSYNRNNYNNWDHMTDGMDDDENWEWLHNAGYICAYESYGATFTGVTPTQDADVAAYVALALNSTSDEVQQQYGAYPIILAKYQLMVQLIDELGYVK